MKVESSAKAKDTDFHRREACLVKTLSAIHNDDKGIIVSVSAELTVMRRERPGVIRHGDGGANAEMRRTCVSCREGCTEAKGKEGGE